MEVLLSKLENDVVLVKNILQAVYIMLQKIQLVTVAIQ